MCIGGPGGQPNMNMSWNFLASWRWHWTGVAIVKIFSAGASKWFPWWNFLAPGIDTPPFLCTFLFNGIVRFSIYWSSNDMVKVFFSLKKDTNINFELSFSPFKRFHWGGIQSMLNYLLCSIFYDVFLSYNWPVTWPEHHSSGCLVQLQYCMFESFTDGTIGNRNQLKQK